MPLAKGIIENKKKKKKKTPDIITGRYKDADYTNLSMTDTEKLINLQMRGWEVDEIGRKAYYNLTPEEKHNFHTLKGILYGIRFVKEVEQAHERKRHEQKRGR